MKKRCGVALCAQLILIGAAAHADDTSTALQDATNQAAIAAQNAATAQSVATAATAQATAQQALAASHLANQKSQIDNIQAALSTNVSSLRQTGTVAAPAINAVYGRLLSEQLGEWLAKDAATPASTIQASKCVAVVMYRPSLTTLTLAWRSTSEKLSSTWSTLHAATEQLASRQLAVGNAKPAVVDANAKPNKPAGGGFGVVGAAGIASIANFALNVAAALKTQTVLSTASIAPASKIVNAAVAGSLSGIELYDPDMASQVVGTTPSVPGMCARVTDVSAFKALPLEVQADCVADAIGNAKSVVDTKTSALAALGAAPTPDPNADIRSKTAALGAAATQATADMQALFAPDKTTGAIPFVAAVQGDTYAKALSTPTTCVLSINTISSDADSLVRDGTFTSYKLFLATTTSISWQVSQPGGRILASGYKAIGTSWSKQALD